MAGRGVEGFLDHAYHGGLEGHKVGIVRGRLLSPVHHVPILTGWQGSGGEISSEFAMRTRLLIVLTAAIVLGTGSALGAMNHPRF